MHDVEKKNEFTKLYSSLKHFYCTFYCVNHILIQDLIPFLRRPRVYVSVPTSSCKVSMPSLAEGLTGQVAISVQVFLPIKFVSHKKAENFIRVTITTGNSTRECPWLNFGLTAESTENLIPKFKPNITNLTYIVLIDQSRKYSYKKM